LHSGHFRETKGHGRRRFGTPGRQCCVALRARFFPGHHGPSVQDDDMNKMELVDHIASSTDSSKTVAAAALEAALEGITEALKKGDEVRLVGFGTFSVKQRAETKGRNPTTGAEIMIPASMNARFKTGASLKAALNK
jgi:DNA-binding protein HU-beta